MWKILVFILWLILGWLYYLLDTNYDRDCCGSSDTTEVISPVEENESEKTGTINNVVKSLGPLVFNYSDMNPVVNAGFDVYRDSILRGLGENQILEITGLYCEGEEAPEGFDNLGLARAEKTKEIMSKYVDPERMRIRAVKVGEEECDKNGPFESARFGYKIMTEKIKEIDDRTLIYFPQNSTNKLNDAEVEAYLDDVAEVVTKNGKNRSFDRTYRCHRTG